MSYTVTVTSRYYRKSFTTTKTFDSIDHARNYSRVCAKPNFNGAGKDCNPNKLIIVRKDDNIIATWTPSQKWTHSS